MEKEPANILVIGMGSWAFGKERRAVSALKHMPLVRPYFLTSKWEDGSVSRLLREHDFEFGRTSLGYLGRARLKWTLINLVHMPMLSAAVINAYRKRQCEVILVLSIQSFVNALAPILLLKVLKGARVVLYLGDIPSNNGVHHAIGAVINRMADKVIVNSRAVWRGITAIGVDERKMELIYNGVEVERFRQESFIEFRKNYGWPENSLLVGYLGQFSRNKGVLDFVHAAELVLRRDGNCRFLMIGKVDGLNGVGRELLEHVRTAKLEDYIAFPGRIEEIEKAYAGLDIVVVPSRYDDPAANVNIETMASGIPVVATRVGGAPELVVDGETGFLVEKDQPDQISERILRLARDVELRRRMGNAGRDRVSEMFNLGKNARLVEKVLLDG